MFLQIFLFGLLCTANGGSRYKRGYNPEAVVHNAYAQERAYLAGSALPAQHVAAAHRVYEADRAKTELTLTNANALQAINGIAALDRAASYSFSGGGGSGGGGYGYGK